MTSGRHRGEAVASPCTALVWVGFALDGMPKHALAELVAAATGP